LLSETYIVARLILPEVLRGKAALPVAACARRPMAVSRLSLLQAGMCCGDVCDRY